MESALVAHAAQFGAAGLIAWMWLAERRGAVVRERQLGESHERLMEQRVQLDALLRVVQEQARAVAALEATQRAMVSALERVAAGVGVGRGEGSVG